MKHRVFQIILTFIFINLQTMAQSSIPPTSNHRILICYFSASGTTANAAKQIARITQGELFSITPEKIYTDKDLDWHDTRSRSSSEMNDTTSRPAIKEIKGNMEIYDVVFIGYPIWWNLAPRIINTFIEKHHLENKIVVPFATSGGSSIDHSVTILKKSYPSINFKSGKLLNHSNEKEISQWIESLNL